MTTSNTVWLVVAVVVAVLVLATLIVLARRMSNRRHHLRAEGIREQARVEKDRVGRREALAQETAAKARAAQAEADVKAAEAARLQERAAAHQSDAATSREELDARLKHADSIDPKAKTRAGHDADQLGDGSGEQAYQPVNDAGGAASSTASPPETHGETTG